MAITDEARNHLFNTLREQLGAQDAATMMELLPPVGWADVARQRDIDRLEANMERRFEHVDRRFDDVDRRFDDVDRRFDDVDRRFGDLPSILATKDDLREMTNHLIAWTLGFGTLLVAAGGLLHAIG